MHGPGWHVVDAPSGGRAPEQQSEYRHQRLSADDKRYALHFGRAAARLLIAQQPLIVTQSALVAAVPSQSPYAHKTSIDFAKLAEDPFISYPGGYGSALDVALEELCAQSGVSPRLGPTVSQITTLVSLVAAERGGAIVPDFVSTLQRPGVAYVPLDGSHVMAQTVSWIEPFSSRGVERFVELARIPEDHESALDGRDNRLSAR